MTTHKAGWGFPALARKAHYFVDAQSICGHWLYTGHLYDLKDDGPDNCVACKRLRLKAKPEVSK